MEAVSAVKEPQETPLEEEEDEEEESDSQPARETGLPPVHILGGSSARMMKAKRNLNVINMHEGDSATMWWSSRNPINEKN